MTAILNILMMEDDINDVELIAKTLERAGLQFRYLVVTDKTEFVAAVSTYNYDVILADNSLPQFDALSALAIVQQIKPGVPFILVTGTVSEEFAVNVIQKGADDYILKGNLRKLPSAIEGAISKCRVQKEKEMAEKALKESEQRFRILFESASDGIVLANSRSEIIDANARACLMTGYSLNELKKLTIGETFFEEDVTIMPVRTGELQQGDTIISERRLKRKDGTGIFVELSAKLLPDGRFQAFARDITERRLLEERLLKEKINYQKRLAQATLDGQEKERTEIGKELHDNVNQILTATKLFLNVAQYDESVQEDMLARSIDNISLAIEEIRKLSKSLVTPTVSELGLMEYLEDLVNMYRLTTKMEINLVMTEGDMEQINPQQQVALYRIVQEQLNNIIKHAAASHVDLLLEITGHSVKLEIKDNGNGFDVQSKRAGIGISNMQSRAELLNGQFHLTSAPGKGCTLTVELPFDEGREEN